MYSYISLFTLLVLNYDEAIQFYCEKLGFHLLEDTPLTAEKRWVRVAPRLAPYSTAILLAQAKNDQERAAVGKQTGGRVGFFLHTYNFDKTFAQLVENGVHFVRQPSKEEYGQVAVFEDLYGNLWDLIQPSSLEIPY